MNLEKKWRRTVNGPVVLRPAWALIAGLLMTGSFGLHANEPVRLGVVDLDVTPALLQAALVTDSTDQQVLTLTATEGLIDWTAQASGASESVQDGSFELGYQTNPFWTAFASIAGDSLPICSPKTCFSIDLSTEGDWFLWLGGTAPMTSWAEQDVTIVQNLAATLRFNMLMGSTAPGSAQALLTISVGGATVATFTEADVGDFGAFTPVEIDVSPFATGNTQTLRFDFENTGTENLNMFIDEVSLVSGPAADTPACKSVNQIPWLSINPSGGQQLSGAVELTVTFDSTGLAVGEYRDAVCIASSDPDEPIIAVLLLMTVLPQPLIFDDRFEQNNAT